MLEKGSILPRQWQRMTWKEHGEVESLEVSVPLFPPSAEDHRVCRCSWLQSSELAEGLLSASPGEDGPGDAEVAVFRVPCRDWHPVEGPHEACQCG